MRYADAGSGQWTSNFIGLRIGAGGGAFYRDQAPRHRVSISSALHPVPEIERVRWSSSGFLVEVAVEMASRPSFGFRHEPPSSIRSPAMPAGGTDGERTGIPTAG